MNVYYTTPAGISVLDDLGLDRGFPIKAKLAFRIQKMVEERGLNHAMLLAKWAYRSPSYLN